MYIPNLIPRPPTLLLSLFERESRGSGNETNIYLACEINEVVQCCIVHCLWAEVEGRAGGGEDVAGQYVAGNVGQLL